MNLFLKIILLAFLILYSNQSSAQIRFSDKIKQLEDQQAKQPVQNQQKNQELKIDSSYLARAAAEKKKIKEELEKTSDPKKRNELILRLYKINNSYYDPKVRIEMIRKKYPGYASRVEAYKTLSKERRKAEVIKSKIQNMQLHPEIRGTLESRWENVPEWEKIYHCKNAVKECFAGASGALLKCRFVLDRCYEYIDKDTFKKVRGRFAPVR